MIYDDGYTTRFNPDIDNYDFVKVTAGTIIIEASLLIQYGRRRFTLAHELAHWVLHKELYTGTNIEAATYGMNNYCSNSIEWQADYLAKAILMPERQVRRGFSMVQNERTDRKIMCLSRMFGVSRQAMEIRLKELKLIKSASD